MLSGAFSLLLSEHVCIHPRSRTFSSGSLNAVRTSSLPLPCCDASISRQTYTSMRSAFETRTPTTGITSFHATLASPNSDSRQEKKGRRGIHPFHRCSGSTHSSAGESLL